MQRLFLILLLAGTANPEPQGPRVTPLTYNFIRHQEKLVLTAYPDPASPRARYCRLTGVDDPSLNGAPWTVGYGCTGKHITEGTRWTRRRAELALEQRVDRLARLLDASLTTRLSQAQYDAVLSFAFNVGSGVLKPGSKLMVLLNARQFAGVAKMLRHYTMAAGSRFPGLIARRDLEISLFNREVN